MARPGTAEQPLRVAIIGAGPTGYYATDQLLRQEGAVVEVDLYDRLPTPYGLVRLGVAPDHQKIKSVTAAFDKVAAHPRFRFFGGVEFGKDVTLADLRAHYHQILYCTGAQTDRRMGIPGEDLEGSHPATEFVAWYNGHPDYCDYRFDLSVERAAVVGVGNVAVDVARILCRSPEELARTDIADYALEALTRSRIKEVYLLGRRGPAQAAFTNPEIKELGELADADLAVVPAEVELDAASRESIAKSQDRAAGKKVEILQAYAQRPPAGKARRLVLRFLVSPVELLGDAGGRVAGMRLGRDELYATPTGTLQARATDRFEELAVGGRIEHAQLAGARPSTARNDLSMPFASRRVKAQQKTICPCRSLRGRQRRQSWRPGARPSAAGIRAALVRGPLVFFIPSAILLMPFR